MKIVFSLFVCIFFAFGSELKIYTEEMPPYNYMHNGTVLGISTRFFQEIMKEHKTPIKNSQITLGTWQVGYEAVLHDTNSMIYSAARFEKREDLFKWVGPIDTLIVGVIAKKSRKIKIDSPEDFNRYTIGVLHKSAAEQLLKNLGVKDEHLDRFSNIHSQLKKLAFDRLDMVAFGYEGMRFVQKDLGIDPNEYELIYTLKKADLYFAFNKESDEKYIKELNEIAAKLKAKGFIQKIKRGCGL